MTDFKIYMIRIKDHEVSEKYANHCVKSWNDAGFEVEFYDAITPDTLHLHSGIRFGRKGNPMRHITDTEQACFYSQWNLWKQCADEGVPYLILEHDAWLEKPSWIEFRDQFQVQYMGEHAMEAVMFHPEFCEKIMKYTSDKSVTGPMHTVDTILGHTMAGKHNNALPHARLLGPEAPVRSVIDPTLGTTVDHPNMQTGMGSTADRVTVGKDQHQFKIVRL